MNQENKANFQAKNRVETDDKTLVFLTLIQGQKAVPKTGKMQGVFRTEPPPVHLPCLD
jgi:hypothetical protein